MELEIGTDVAIDIFLKTVDYLLAADERDSRAICAWTNNKKYANFSKSNFDKVCIKKASPSSRKIKIMGGGGAYRQLISIFRDMGWLVCQKERFTSTQWINGKARRVITVDYPRYLCLKKLESFRVRGQH